MIKLNNLTLTLSLIIFVISLFISNNVFILLTTFLFPGALLSNYYYKDKYFFYLIIFLELCLLLVFSADNLISFYIYFEGSLIPLFLIIIKFGGSNKQRASYLLFLYTLLGSLLILIGFIIIIKESGTIYFNILNLYNFNNNYIFLLIFISLAIKTPLIPLHIWLPRAHSEAIISNSILLAALVLKIATFAYLRILLDLIPLNCIYFLPLIQIISIISLFYSSLSCFRQNDSKVLIAISSIAHISIVLLGLFANNIYGLYGSILLSLAHGFVSPLLFIIFGSILYDRYHTRIIRYYRGLTLTIPLISLFLFLATIANLGLPLTINFLGEILSIFALFKSNIFFGFLSTFSIVFSAIYSLWLFCRVCFGSYSNYLFYASDINLREFHIILPWLFITILFGFVTSPFNNLFFINDSIILNNLSLLLY